MRNKIFLVIFSILLISCTTLATHTSTETSINKKHTPTDIQITLTNSPMNVDFSTRIPSPISTFTPMPSIWQIWFKGYSCEGVELCGEGQPPESSYFSINSDGTELRSVEIPSIPTPQLPAGAPPLPDGFSSAPQVSPDKAMLMYGARENGVFGLYLVDSQTGEITKLYQTQIIEDHLFWIGTACWSPDGNIIDFMLHSRVGMNNQPPMMYRINRDGSNIQAIYDFPGLENAWFGACSPDGREITLSIGGNTAIESNGLYVINRDTGELKQILSNFFAITVSLPQK